MAENPEIIKEPRVNISLTGDSALKIEQLRSLLEQRLKQRLSIAQVIKRVTEISLNEELATVQHTHT